MNLQFRSFYLKQVSAEITDLSEEELQIIIYTDDHSLFESGYST